MQRYYLNGKLDDEAGTGVSVEIRDDGVDSNARTAFIGSNGEANLGYLAREVTKEEAELWQKRIANPDMVEYFPGIFRGIGVVNKTVYEKLQADRHKRRIANISVSRVNALLALARYGISRDMINGAIASMPDTERTEAEIMFAESATFRRSNQLVAAIGKSFNLSEDQIDQMFIDAAVII